ncbi:MAG: serine--tRNA ligase [Candidatus Thermoplasmatota archaeon]|nr:serine--tRNA ligase [Candidatus Thermoplasmatota archaeon]
MLDIKLIREHSELVKDMLAKRNVKAPLDELIQCDKDLRACRIELDKLRNLRNITAKKVAELKKKGVSVENEILRMKEFNEKIEFLEGRLNELSAKRNELLLRIPNLLHETVPIGTKNVVVREWGAPRKLKFKARSHVELLELLDIGDIERAARATGARFYYLKNELFQIALALVTFTVKELVSKGFIAMETPFLLRKEAIQGAIDLADFENVIYKLENEDLYLIATAEHTLLAYHMNEVFEEKDMPKCYVGYSTNFRKEAGAHGKDTKGIFRVRQFDKVEQFVFCKPSETWQWHEKLIANAEELYQKLEIPYRVVSLCSTDLGKVSAKTYDLEAWMPAQNEYREIVSCSNCTDYQARRLNIRYRTKEGTKFVHTLNSTAMAIQRTLVAILENYQQADGSVVVPKVLRAFTGIKRITPKK